MTYKKLFIFTILSALSIYNLQAMHPKNAMEIDTERVEQISTNLAAGQAFPPAAQNITAYKKQMRAAFIAANKPLAMEIDSEPVQVETKSQSQQDILASKTAIETIDLRTVKKPHPSRELELIYDFFVYQEGNEWRVATAHNANYLLIWKLTFTNSAALEFYQEIPYSDVISHFTMYHDNNGWKVLSNSFPTDTLHVWDLTTQKTIAKLGSPHIACPPCPFQDGNKHMALIPTRDNKMVIINLTTGKIEHTFKLDKNSSPIGCTMINKERKKLRHGSLLKNTKAVVIDNNSKVYVYDLIKKTARSFSSKAEPQIPSKRSFLKTYQFNGEQILLAGFLKFSEEANTIYAYRLSDGKQLFTLQGPEESYLKDIHLYETPTGPVAICCWADNSIEIFDLKTLKCLHDEIYVQKSAIDCLQLCHHQTGLKILAKGGHNIMVFSATSSPK